MIGTKGKVRKESCRKSLLISAVTKREASSTVRTTELSSKRRSAARSFRRYGKAYSPGLYSYGYR